MSTETPLKRGSIRHGAGSARQIYEQNEAGFALHKRQPDWISPATGLQFWGEAAVQARAAYEGVPDPEPVRMHPKTFAYALQTGRAHVTQDGMPRLNGGAQVMLDSTVPPSPPPNFVPLLYGAVYGLPYYTDPSG